MKHLAPSRLIPAARAIGLVVLAIVVLEVVLRLTFGKDVKGAPPPFDQWAITNFNKRVAAFEKLADQGRVSDSKLAAVIGVSTVQHGLDPALLKENDPQFRNWLVIGSGGRNITHLAIYARPLLNSSLKPHQVILGLHQFMMRDNARDLWEDNATLLEHLKRHQFGKLAKDLLWIDRNHGPLLDGTNFLVAQLSDGMRRTVGLPMYHWYEPDPQPLSGWVDKDGERAKPDELASQFDGFAKQLVPENFTSNNGQADSLQWIVQKFTASGSKVIGVLMPESAPLRALYPPVVAARFADALAQASGPNSHLPIVDLRDAIPESEFFDHVHLNTRGRERLSKLLSVRVPAE